MSLGPGNAEYIHVMAQNDHKRRLLSIVIFLYHYMYVFSITRPQKDHKRLIPPWGSRGFKSRIRSPYPQLVVKGN